VIRVELRSRSPIDPNGRPAQERRRPAHVGVLRCDSPGVLTDLRHVVRRACRLGQHLVDHGEDQEDRRDASDEAAPRGEGRRGEHGEKRADGDRRPVQLTEVAGRIAILHFCSLDTHSPHWRVSLNRYFTTNK